MPEHDKARKPQVVLFWNESDLGSSWSEPPAYDTRHTEDVLTNVLGHMLQESDLNTQVSCRISILDEQWHRMYKFMELFGQEGSFMLVHTYKHQYTS
jgi:hypothetical protein